QHLRGYYVTGNELHAFQLCGGAQLTWVELQGYEPGIEKFADAPACFGAPRPDCIPFPYIELDATVSERCTCGHLGKFARKLDINELLLVSQTAPADCAHLDPLYPQ
ncbi:MAG TPA: hypothetical protein VN914_09080, partial [Polyangia bacterium]|nr:hypothetical protein [Polyangia bacterium]